MSGLTSLSVISTTSNYRNDEDVDAAEQNNNENTISAKVNEIVTALSSNIPETDLANIFTAIQSFAAGIKTDSITSYTADGDIIITPNGTGLLKYTGSDANLEVATKLYIAQQIAAAAIGPGVFMGATSSLDGTTGIVVQPVAGDQIKYLKGDGTFSRVQSDEVDLNFQTKSSAYNVVSGDELWIDTSAGSFTITLPATPTANDWVRIVDVKGTFATNALVIDNNTKPIMGLSTPMNANLSYVSFKLVYKDSSDGWRVI